MADTSTIPSSMKAGLVGAGSNVYSSIRDTMEEKKGKCQYK